MRSPINNLVTISATNFFFCQEFQLATGAYPADQPIFAFCNFQSGKSGGNNISQATGTINFEGISVEHPAGSGTWVAAPSGSFPIALTAPTPGVLLPAIPVTLAANTVYRFRVCYNGPSSAQLATQISTPVDFCQGAASSLAAKLTDNSSISNANSHGNVHMPCYMLAKGGNGDPAFLIIGDSIGYGSNQGGVSGFFYTARKEFGYIPCGLDDNSSARRLSYLNMAIPGDTPQWWTTRTNVALPMDCLKLAFTALGYWPFDFVICQHAHNSSAASTGPILISAMQALYARLKAEWGKPLIQAEVLPQATSSDGYQTLANENTVSSLWGTSGSFWQFNAAVGVNGLSDPTAALRVSGDIVDSFAGWLADSYDTTTNRDKYALPNASAKSTAAVGLAANASVSSVTVATGDGSKFAAGQYVLVDSGTGIDTARYFGGIIKSIAGDVLTCQPENSCTTAAAIGAPVTVAPHDNTGTHPSPWTSVNVLQAPVIAWKAGRQAAGWA